MRVRERHLQRVEREVDVGAVLVAAGREVALHQLGGVLRQRPAVVAGPRPVAVGGLGDDVAALLERFEHDADVELRVEGVLDADLDVVEIDEDCNLETCFCHVAQVMNSFLLPPLATSRAVAPRRVGAADKGVGTTY